MMYLNFYNGRHTPEEELDDFGFEGPVLGPFRSIQITSGYHIKATDIKDYLFEFTISKNGLVSAYGSLYRDFSIVDIKYHEFFYKERWKKTKKIVRSNTDPALFLNEKKEWIKVYIEKCLKGSDERIHHGFYNGYRHV